MKFSRRDILAGAAGAAALGAGLPRGAAAQGAVNRTPRLRSGRPFAGQELRILCVNNSQFHAAEARMAAFTEQTGITARWTYVPFANLREALASEMVGGGGDFDLVMAMDQWIASLANLFEPIEQRITEKGIDLARFPEPHLRQGRVNNQLLGMPCRGHVQLMFFRKDIFDKHGLRAPETWDEMVSHGLTIQSREQGMSGVAVPYARNAAQNLMVWYNFLWGRGGSLFDERGQPAFNNQAGLQSVQDYVDLLRRHRVTPQAAVSFNEQDAVNSFAQGNSAMVPVWWWVRAVLLNPQASRLTPEQIGFAPLPGYAGRPRTTATNTWIWGVARRSRRKDPAMELVTWLCSTELERDILLDTRLNEVVSVMFPNMRDEEVNRRWGGMHRFGADTLASTQSMSFGADWPQVSEVLETAMNEAATGARTVPDAFNNAANAVRRIARRG